MLIKKADSLIIVFTVAALLPISTYGASSSIIAVTPTTSQTTVVFARQHALYAVMALLAHPLYLYYTTKPTNAPARYSMERIKRAFIHVIKGNRYKSALPDLVTELKYFYYDGIGGHAAGTEECDNDDTNTSSKKNKKKETKIEGKGLIYLINIKLAPLVQPLNITYKIIESASSLTRGDLSLYSRIRDLLTTWAEPNKVTKALVCW